VLDSVLGKLARQHDPNVLVGFDTADDAGVYQLTPEVALVQTIDFFTPIVDDAYIFGQIAATNSLSDIYAMGGRPISALTMVCFPDGGDVSLLQEMLSGGLSKMIEAGCTVIGGHSVRDPEIKLGYAVTGTIHPQKILTNSGARAGDRLLFTKAIGTGVISTAIKRGKAEIGWISKAIVSMTTLNKLAAEIVTGSSSATGGFPVHAMTDVTGFGLIGHAREMALGSGVSLKIHAATVPLLDGALECVRAGFIPGGLKANREFAEGCVEYEAAVPEEIRNLLYDPQTAGGLLIAAAAPNADRLLASLQNVGVPAVEIGEVVPKSKPPITLMM
jgi:selenide,water dikinase